MAYTNNDGVDDTIPDGTTAPASSIDTYIQDVKKAINERMNYLFGGNFSSSTEQTIEKLVGAVTFNGTGKQANQPVTDLGNISGAVALDFDIRGNYIKATLTGNTTFTVSNMRVGTTYVLMLAQNGTGGYTFALPSDVRWAGGTSPTINTTANRVTALTITPYTTSVGLAALVGTNYNVS